MKCCPCMFTLISHTYEYLKQSISAFDILSVLLSIMNFIIIACYSMP